MGTRGRRPAAGHIGKTNATNSCRATQHGRGRLVIGSFAFLLRIGLLAAIALGPTSRAALAQSTFPARTVKIIVPFPAGAVPTILPPASSPSRSR